MCTGSRCFKKVKCIFLKLFIFVLGTLLYCEYLHYYVIISMCRWPQLEVGIDGGAEEASQVRAMVVADTHLLGSHAGHWFDKLRREWQMHRAFQTAVWLHQPHVVIFLGDLFDEGKWCSSHEFSAYVHRFSSLFALPKRIRLLVVPGNHDMGFHYSITSTLSSRFERAFSTPSVYAVAVRDVLLVGINSMAMHGDDCSLCRAAQDRLKRLSEELTCSRSTGPCPSPHVLPLLTGPAPRPVLLQHYPLFRPSDAHCNDSDAAPPEEREAAFRPRWECVSEESTEQLLSLLEPRLVLSGHTHHGCTTLHQHPPPPLFLPPTDLPDDDPEYAAEEREYQEQQQRAAAGAGGVTVLTIPEVTVPSFSWRNKKSPTFAMVTLTASRHALLRCAMPREQTVLLLYCCSGLLFLLSLARRKLWCLAVVYPRRRVMGDS